MSAERRCSGDPSAMYTKPASLTPLTLARSSASARRSTDSPRTDAPRPRSSRSPGRRRAPGARTRPPSAARRPRRRRARSRSASNSRQPSCHSPPPISASVPDGCLRAHGFGSLPGGNVPFLHEGCGSLLARGGHIVTVKRVGIVGSGIMGSGIAEVAAKAGFEVSPAQSPAELRRRDDGGTREVARQAGRQGQARRRRARRRRSDGSRAVTDLGELAECDLVIESIVEDLAVKKHLFNELDRVCRDAAVLATNTSTLPVVEMAMETPARPGVRDPLLQPGADDAARRGGALRSRRPTRPSRRRGPSPSRAARTRSSCGTRPGSS